MGTVDVTVEEHATVRQTGLVPGALDVLQPYLPAPCPKHRTVQGRLGQTASQLQAHHVGLAEVPAVVAHGAPLVVAKHLHSARAPVLPVHQSDPTYGSEADIIVQRHVIQLWIVEASSLSNNPRAYQKQ